ncbi:MAG: lipid-A-disaccharide synthase [Acidobacteria bacterium]|nr:lipid-A-disaccharide synthase [Acidobacteriota bacterium]
MPATVLISCGEPSGDLYAGALAASLRSLDPGVRLLGLGGDRFEAAGGELVGDYRGLAVTGIAEAVRVLPQSLLMYRRLVGVAREVRPDVAVVIDFPDFNFRLAASLRRLGIPLVYYIPPQLWAWRSGRMRRLQAIANRILVIFPFEPEIYRRAGTEATFVGHPLLELARPTEARETFLRGAGLDPGAPVIALLPGSRPNEVRAILPTLIEATAAISAAEPHAQYVVARAPGLDSGLFAIAERAPLRHVSIVEGRADDVLAACDLVITASGTATVQAAIHERPMVVVYRVSPLTYAVGRRFVHLDTFAMVNLVAGERVVPELIQEAFTPLAVADEALRLLRDGEARDRALRGVRAVKEKLGGPGASRRAAEAVLELARRPRNVECRM